jgi:hypothetical protein
LFAVEDNSKPIAKAAPFVKHKERWLTGELNDFLNALPDEEILSLMKALKLESKSDKRRDVRELQKLALWRSSNILAYPFRDEAGVNYHELVSWVASFAGVESELIKHGSTFALEHQTEKQVFGDLWDKLTVEQRIVLLDKIDPNGHIKDKAAIATMTGAGALATLSATVAFSGFAFYTTMAVTISTVAGFFGLTLPFAAYAGASSLVAFLSGPVGWAIAGTAALGGFAWAGRADVKGTADFVARIHSLKVAALKAAGIPETEIFPPSIVS